MKIILSRKGFDSQYGGYPSPIIDGRLLSLPIPSEDNIRYSELMIDDKLTYYNVMKELKPKIKVRNDKGVWERKPLEENATCHLDPDIYKNIIERPDNWRPLFGQVNAAQCHLKNQEIKEGDVFLFFGWFKKTKYSKGKIIFDPNEPRGGKHIIFGYFQIGEIFTNRDVPNWMKYHPHAQKPLVGRKNNTIYIARKKLSWGDSIDGSGTFNYRQELVLTKEGYSRSKWNLDAIKNVEISYHNKESWKYDYFQSAAKGQEFVIEDNPIVEKWVKKLISPTED